MKSMVRNVVVVSCVMLCAFVSGAIYAAPAEAPSAAYQISAQTWAKNYFEFFSSHGLKTDFRLTLPEVWLFDPDGHMVRMVTTDKDPSLAKLAADFPSAVGTKALPKEPTSAQARDFLVHALSDKSVPAPRKGRWYAVLILMKGAGAPTCNHCVAYDKAFGALQAKHADLLDTVRVTVTIAHRQF